MDGSVTVGDANWLNQYISGTRQLTVLQLYLSDLTRDGMINQSDYLQISRSNVRLSSNFDSLGLNPN